MTLAGIAVHAKIANLEHTGQLPLCQAYPGLMDHLK
jgi:hypothetical protein